MKRSAPLGRAPFSRPVPVDGEPLRWSSMAPGGPLARYQGLPAGAGLRRARLALVAGDGPPVVPLDQERQQRRSATIPREVRLLVLERDRYRCTCCGRSIIGQRYSLGHRLRASQGGKAVPSNLLVFLGWGGEACHGRIDSRRDPSDEENGLTVRSWKDPALVPVKLHSGIRVWLTDDGRYSYEPPEETS